MSDSTADTGGTERGDLMLSGVGCFSSSLWAVLMNRRTMRKQNISRKDHESPLHPSETFLASEKDLSRAEDSSDTTIQSYSTDSVKKYKAIIESLA